MEIQTQGWLPIDIEFDAEPALVTEAQVRWLEFGSTPLAEPFFGQTVEKRKAVTPPPMEVETRLEAMLQLSERLPAVIPSGFIFHVSHCGSTLLANSLRAGGAALVVSEAASLARLTRLYPEPRGRYLATRWNSMRRKLMEALFTLFAHYRTGHPEPLVIKFASFNLLCMNMVRAYWPEVPCVVLVRNPVEVLASALAERGWLALKAEPERARVIFGLPDLEREMPDEEFCARVLGRHLAAALDSVDRNCKVIDYEDLSPKRIREIALFFGVHLPADTDELDRVLAVYSKDPASARQFQDDRSRKQESASPEARSAVHRWAMPGYSALRGKGFW